MENSILQCSSEGGVARNVNCTGSLASLLSAAFDYVDKSDAVPGIESPNALRSVELVC